MLAWIPSPAAAAPWEVAEQHPLEAGPAIAWSPSFGGAPVVISGGDGGLVAFDRGGEVRGSAGDLRVRALVVRQLDGTGEPEVVACGPQGLALLRADARGSAPPRVLSSTPCEDVVAYDLAEYPALATVSDGRLVRWTPTRQGLIAEPSGPRARAGTLASAGRRLAVVGEDGDLVMDHPDERVRGPISAVAGGPDGIVWAGAGAWSGGELPDEVSGLVVEGPFTWFLDAEGQRLREAAGPWIPLPVAPVRAVAVPGPCPDLWVVDASGRGVRLVGRCGPEVPPPAEPVPVPVPAPEPEPEPTPAPGAPPVAADGLPPAPAAVALDAHVWPAVNVRVGESLTSRVSWGDGHAWRWHHRGGPPGFRVTKDGHLEYEAEEDHVGRWRASIRSRDWPRSRWAGLEIRVWPADVPFGPDPGVDAVPTPPRPPPPADPVVRVRVGAGLAAGLAKTNGSQWENLGRTPTGGGASPFGAAVAEARLAAGVELLGGVDAAPFFAYPSTPGRRPHLLALTTGLQGRSGATSVGAFGTYGIALRGVGVRFTTTPWVDRRDRPTGLEIRATWLAPQIGGELVAAWVWTL